LSGQLRGRGGVSEITDSFEEENSNDKKNGGSQSIDCEIEKSTENIDKQTPIFYDLHRGNFKRFSQLSPMSFITLAFDSAWAAKENNENLNTSEFWREREFFFSWAAFFSSLCSPPFVGLGDTL